ncbi:MAG: hypothetical protein ACOX1L_05765 [Erysipelotrichaceae bacterium]
MTELLKKNGFEINQNKTRLVYSSSRQEVTGLTVNDKINASRNFINKTRAMANQLYKTNSFQINGEEGTLNQLEGRLAFINQLDFLNNKLEYTTSKKKTSKKYIYGLNAREKQYQYFLFYKYFFKPIKPTIVTEGKTDIVHIKCALMKYYKDYPKLITKNAFGEYVFNVYFLNKTERLDYFLGVSINGADTMKNIWNFYTGNNNFDNIFKYIKNKNQTESLEKVNPVILLFDNEQKTDRPLKNFLSYSKSVLEGNQISKNLIENLFLQTLPLNGLEECEIEDLYKQEVLDVIIDGKQFDRNLKDDSKNIFGKHIFSMYIKKNYKAIDFSNFIEILDSINRICQISLR